MFYANTPISKWSRIRDARFPMEVQHHLPGNCFTAILRGDEYSILTRQMAFEDSGLAEAVLKWLPSVGIVGATDVTFDIQHRLLSVPESRAMMVDELLFAAPIFDLKGWLVRIYDHNGKIENEILVEDVLIPRYEIVDAEEMEAEYRQIADLDGVLGFYVLARDGCYYNLPVRRWMAVKANWDGRSSSVLVTGINDPNYMGLFNLAMNQKLSRALFENPHNSEIQISYSSVTHQVDGRSKMFGLRYEGQRANTELDHQLCGVF